MFKIFKIDSSLPLSIISTFVKTPNVLSPSGSTLAAMFKASLTAKSALAAETANIIAFGLLMY